MLDYKTRPGFFIRVVKVCDGDVGILSDFIKMMVVELAHNPWMVLFLLEVFLFWVFKGSLVEKFVTLIWSLCFRSVSLGNSLEDSTLLLIELLQLDVSDLLVFQLFLDESVKIVDGGLLLSLQFLLDFIS